MSRPFLWLHGVNVAGALLAVFLGCSVPRAEFQVFLGLVGAFVLGSEYRGRLHR